MNNICTICRATIDVSWSELQNKLKRFADNSLLNMGFVERCIYCYKSLLELTEQKEHEWYQEVIKIVEKGGKC